MSDFHEHEDSHYEAHHSRRFDGALLTGGISSVVGWLGTTLFSAAKLIPFDREVAKRTRDDILGRGGLGAGIAESGSFAGNASGMGNHIIEEAHRLTVIEEPGFGFAKRIMQMGGRSTVALFAGAVAGVAGLGAYLAFNKREAEPEVVYAPEHNSYPVEANETHASGTHKKNWQDSVQKETVTEQARGA